MMQQAADRPTIARAAPAAATELAGLGAASFAQSYADTLPAAAIAAHCATHHVGHAWRRLLDQPGVACWLARDLAEAVGYVLLTPPDLPGQRAGDLEIRRLYVLAARQGGGLGAALLAAACAHARALGAKRVILGVYGRNLRAQAFYQRQGFAQIGTRQFQVGPLLCDDLVMGCAL